MKTDFEMMIDLQKGLANKKPCKKLKLSSSELWGYYYFKTVTSRFVCYIGKVKVTLVSSGIWQEIILSGDKPEILTVKPKVAIGIENIDGSNSWLIDLSDFHDSDEQIQYTQEELEMGGKSVTK
jgi:dTDP-4-dehydrorhamnose 3,5-epimerase-like enzyme